MAKGYVSAADVALFLGEDTSDSVVMADIAIMLDYAEAAIDDYCQTQFDDEPGTSKLFDGSGHNLLTLGFFLRKLTSVCIVDSLGNELMQLTDVIPEPTPLRTGQAYKWLERIQPVNEYGTSSSGVVLPFPKGLANIKVTGDWGYTADTFPKPVKEAICLTVEHYFRLRNYNSLINLQAGIGQTIQNNIYVTDPSLPLPAMRILDFWKNRVWMRE